MYLDNMTTVADVERKGMQLCLDSLKEDNTICLLSDSDAAIDIVCNVAQGQPARSGMERPIKQSLNLRQGKGYDTAIAWVRAHIQSSGNEEADTLALFSRYVCQTKGSQRTITEGWMRAEGKQRRAALRNQKGLKLDSVVAWHRQAVSAYTWMITNKVPQRQ